MNLSSYVDRLRHDLAVAADAGGDDARALAERLTAPLESAARLVLLEALSEAADEITRELAPGTVEVRLRGTDPVFVVSLPPGDEMFDHLESRLAPPAGAPMESDDGGTSRLNLRLPDSLKRRIEEAARMEGLSLNAWLTRAAAAALGGDSVLQPRSPSGGDRYSGWVR